MYVMIIGRRDVRDFFFRANFRVLPPREPIGGCLARRIALPLEKKKNR